MMTFGLNRLKMKMNMKKLGYRKAAETETVCSKRQDFVLFQSVAIASLLRDPA